MFGTKKSQTQPEPVETIAAQEHKQSIGNQVMEALGVGENGTGLDEESEILMPKQNQRQLEAEGVVKESVCVISKDAVIGGGIDVKGDLMVAGKVMGHISASTVTCVGETSYIEGNVTCNKLRMHGGKIKGHVTVREKADINGEINGDIECLSEQTAAFGEHAVVAGTYIRCSMLKVEPGAQIAAKIEMKKPNALPASTGSSETRQRSIRIPNQRRDGLSCLYILTGFQGSAAHIAVIRSRQYGI